tara:strand:- start:5201 stop:5425 length:225 start_codon:yes stop_codon:yes gene_type:complete
MSLKDKVEAMSEVTRVRDNVHGYSTREVYSTLYAYIAELEAKLVEASKPAPTKAPTKKAPAKKAPAKKAASKKK